LLKAFRDRLMSMENCPDALKETVRQGFWVSPEVACIFYRKLEEIDPALEM
jgi:hypothetical protein